jgi:hypothetical protein
MNTKSQHAAATLGPLAADATAASGLAALPDLVRFMAARDGRTLRDAAILLGDTLGGDGSARRVELFETCQGAQARPVDDSPALLAELRSEWAAAKGRALDLDGEPFARLAMRASAATDLFGYGVDDKPPPWLLAMLPAHDAELWGVNRTQGARPVALVRLVH